MFFVTILGSGSAGNCALVETAQTRLLIDGGLSARQIGARLALCGVNPLEIDGILLTHEHGDHAGALDVWCKQFATPIFCNRLTAEVLQRDRPGRRRGQSENFAPPRDRNGIGALRLIEMGRAWGSHPSAAPGFARCGWRSGSSTRCPPGTASCKPCASITACRNAARTRRWAMSARWPIFSPVCSETPVRALPHGNSVFGIGGLRQAEARLFSPA